MGKFKSFRRAYARKIGDRFIQGHQYRDGEITIGGEKFEVGDLVFFMIEENLYSGTIESFVTDEDNYEFDLIVIDGEEWSLSEMLWIGVE